jgi:drug/metabolite transporter (DMT)-like permease
MAGYLAFRLAARHLPLAPVAALRETSLIFGTVIRAIAFREPFGRHRVAAATVVAAGVVALALREILKPVHTRWPVQADSVVA